MAYSPYTLTVSMIGLAAVGVLSRPAPLRIGINWPGLAQLLRPRKYPAYWAITLFFWITFIGAWDLADQGYWLARIRIKLPYILLPLLFMVLPAFTPAQRNKYLLFLVVLITLTAIGIIINYLLYTEAITELMKRGKPMPTPRNHIRFSLLVVLAIISGGYLWATRWTWRFPAERYVLAGSTLFLLGFAHFLSVKTGLVVLYATALFALGYFLFFTRRYRVAVIALAALIALPYIALRTIPSLRVKYDYTIHDLRMYQKGEGQVYGDAGRLLSLQVGWDIFRQHPLLGVGADRLQMAVEERFASDEIDYWETLTPHNQYLFTAAATGLVGLGIFLFAFFYPLWHQRHRTSFLLFALHWMLFVLFFIDHPCEVALGVGYHSFFLLLLLKKEQRSAAKRNTNQ